MTTASSRPRKAATPPPAEVPFVVEETMAFESTAKSGHSVVYKGVNLPGRQAEVKILYLGADVVKQLGTPARIKVTIEALPE